MNDFSILIGIVVGLVLLGIIVIVVGLILFGIIIILRAFSRSKITGETID